MASKRRETEKYNSVVPVEDYEHQAAKRTNNPPAGLAHLDLEETPVRTFAYDPHIDPHLDWAGKKERSEIDIPAPSIHVHEELSAQKIIGSVRKQRMQSSLFDIDVLDPDKAVEFYQHQLDWSNRMILGDSLVVMNSLLERERLAGSVQCVYIDPPYGIRYQSNFQPGISKRGVKDKNDEDLTREPEMIQAYRDTWELGVHSYLTYLRDRLTIARELLTDSGSIFVQIGDENVHRVRILLDEIFGSENYVSQITFATTTGTGAPNDVTSIPSIENYLIWYAKEKTKLKFRQLYTLKTAGGAGTSGYTKILLKDGTERNATVDEKAGNLPEGSRLFMVDNLVSAGQSETSSQAYEYQGKTYFPGKGHWKTSKEGLDTLAKAGRLKVSGSRLGYVRYSDDFPALALSNIWTDASSGFLTDKKYVVQTNPTIIERCILMTTDPGDLVLDPTCGSGTTSYVCEEFGRRWITIDTSRIALSIARERLLTSVFPYYQLRDPIKDIDGGFVHQTLPRTTLRSIARNLGPEEVILVDQPTIDKKKTRVTGPFTFESLSRYSVNPNDDASAAISVSTNSSGHLETLLDSLKIMGIPRPGSKPLKIESLNRILAASPLQAEGVFEQNGKQARFAVSVGPQFGAITMAQVSEAIRQAIGFDLIVFTGFAVSADVQEKLGTGKFGSVNVALLLANPDLLVGDLLKKTKSSQTFRLYAAPDVKITKDKEGDFALTVEGVDSFDASSGEVTSFGKSGIQAWFLDTDYDGNVFRVSQGFFPVTNAWEKLAKTLRGTADEAMIEQLHSWTSLPFPKGDNARVAVRVVADDGNESEVVIDLTKVKK
jgi:adenine-specific DNA-methyltransferase